MDELVLDVENAYESLPHICEASQVSRGPDVWRQLGRINELLAASPGDSVWQDESLDGHPVWAEARLIARRLLGVVPHGG